MNKVCLTGRITRDPEIRYTPNGNATLSFSIAVDKQTRDANGNRQADFINCVAWRTHAEFMSRYVKKGNMLSIEGRLQTRTYQAQDGSNRNVTEVLVENVENLSPRDPNQIQSNQNVSNNQNYQNNGYNQGYNQGYHNNTNPYQNNGYQNNSKQQNQFQSGQGYNSYDNNNLNSSNEDNSSQTFNVDVADDDLPF